MSILEHVEVGKNVFQQLCLSIQIYM